MSATREPPAYSTHNKKSRPVQRKSFLSRLGPGLISGASDDDPSGIGTYSQAGAQYGFSLLWTMVFCLPLMVSVQEISARIGRITGRGLAGNIRRHYPRWILYPVVFLLVVANTFNLGADIGAMGDAASMLIGGPALAYAAGFTLLCVVLQLFASYSRCCLIFKWLTLALFSYVATVFVVHAPWKQTLSGTFHPSFQRTGDYWAMFIAILGTTISPYLFFWQASQETEEIKSHAEQEPLKRAPTQAREQLSRIRIDTYIGMTFSNLVAFCIILSAAATLHAHGINDIETSGQAAKALEPLAGRFAFILFALGIVGTGLLAVPVLAGSAAYAVGEAMKWPIGLDRKPLEARGFYLVLGAATVIGLFLNFPAVQHHLHFSPIKALFWSAVINGVVAVPILVIMMLMSHSERVLGPYTRISRTLRAVGWLTTAVMLAAAVGMFVTWKK